MKTNEIKNDAIRVPNSVIQGLTTSNASMAFDQDPLNRLSAFQMVTLLGLFALVDSKRPDREVRTTPTALLEIIEVSDKVAHAVERRWETVSGEQKHVIYTADRHSPAHMQLVNEALLRLFNQSVSLQRYDLNHDKKLAERFIHILDSFGYGYRRNGRDVDLDDLPPDNKKVNVGTDDRPVWRVQRRTPNGFAFTRANHVFFRLNGELAQELRNGRGTICSTLVARKVFHLFREYMLRPAMIRLIMLVLRQTSEEFTRHLPQLIADLGYDSTHPQRAIDQFISDLQKLQHLEMIDAFDMTIQDKVQIKKNMNWHREGNYIRPGS